MGTSSRAKVRVIGEKAFYADFPQLDASNHKPTSLATPYEDNPQKPYYAYNCFAFVVNDRRRWWWPTGHGYWPPEGTRGEETVEELVHVLRVKFGYEPCDNGDYVPGVQKVAIYATWDHVRDKLIPTHIAIQPLSRRGVWKSKMGQNVNMEHDLRALEGDCYGRVVRFLRLAPRGAVGRRD